MTQSFHTRTDTVKLSCFVIVGAGLAVILSLNVIHVIVWAALSEALQREYPLLIADWVVYITLAMIVAAIVWFGAIIVESQQVRQAVPETDDLVDDYQEN